MIAPQKAGLTIGGVPASELAAAYGTPLLAIDTGVFDRNVRAFAEAGARHGVEVAYAGKALLIVALARRLAATPLRLDVCSLGEILTAERAGFPAERIVFHGCGKTDEELQAAVAGRVGRIVCDNREELGRLRDLARERGGAPLDVLLRVNPGIEAHTHEFVRTGGEDSKFGFPLPDVAGAAALFEGVPGLRLSGIHAHIGSQIFEAEPYRQSIDILASAYAQLLESGAPLREIIAGGGFGVDPDPQAPPLDPEPVVATLRATLDAAAARFGFPSPSLGIEPGRALVAAAGTSLYRIVAVKQQGSRRFAIVDGGLADNPRPLLYDAYHHPELAGRTSTASALETTICGRSCENDRMVTAALPSDVTAGDVLALHTTGAYTYSMASNYNRFARPCVVFVEGGRHRAVVRREPLEDVLRNDLDGFERSGEQA